MIRLPALEIWSVFQASCVICGGEKQEEAVHATPVPPRSEPRSAGRTRWITMIALLAPLRAPERGPERIRRGFTPQFGLELVRYVYILELDSVRIEKKDCVISRLVLRILARSVEDLDFHFEQHPIELVHILSAIGS
jgi:hypothetical protein